MPTRAYPIVGTVSWVPTSDGSINILGGWREKHIQSVYVSQLKGVPTYGGAFSGNVQWYAPCAVQLTTAWEAVESAGLLSRVIFWGGSFVPRLIRGSKTKVSNHSFGTAMDINPYENQLGHRPAPVGTYGSVVELVPIFRRYGFRWGGDYRLRKDGMHLEIVTKMKTSDVLDVRVQTQWTLSLAGAVISLRLIDGRTWVALRDVASALRLTITWDGKSITVGDRPYTFPLRNIGGANYTTTVHALRWLDRAYTVDTTLKRIIA